MAARMASRASAVVIKARLAPLSRNCAVADIRSEIHVVPVDLVDRVVGLLCSFRNGVAEPNYTQHTATACYDVVIASGRAGMKNLLRIAVGIIEPCDRHSLRIVARVTTRRHDNSKRRQRVPDSLFR